MDKPISFDSFNTVAPSELVSRDPIGKALAGDAAARHLH